MLGDNVSDDIADKSTHLVSPSCFAGVGKGLFRELRIFILNSTFDELNTELYAAVDTCLEDIAHDWV